MFLPDTNTAAPCVAWSGLRQAAVERAVRGGTTLFTSPPGYLYLDSLACALSQSGRSALWLRLSREHQDPGAVLLDLIGGVRQLRREVGDKTLSHMRQLPGAMFGWASLFSGLGQEIADNISSPFTVVLEGVHHLNHSLPVLNTLSKYFLSKLPPETTVILTTQEPLSAADLPAHTVFRSTDDLRVDVSCLMSVVKDTGIDLPSSNIERIVALSKGCADMVAGVFMSSADLGVAPVIDALDRAASADDLLARLARAYLSSADSDVQRGLALTLHLDYAQPALIHAALGQGMVLRGPWLQHFANGLFRIREVWRAALHSSLRMWGHPTSATLGNAAHYLASQDILGQAVLLYLSLGDTRSAAQVVAACADTFLDYGLWHTLDDWLNRFPPATLHLWPWLIYTRGEITAAQGDVKTARRIFAVAATLFTAHHDADGACQSLLAESTLSSWQGDHAHAQTQALAASAMADAAGLDWHLGWAMWQLGCMAASNDDLDSALAYFGRAGAIAAFTSDELVAEIIRRVEFLALEQRNLRNEREHYRRAYFAAEVSEHDAAGRLRALLGAPLEGLGSLLSAHGWSRTPLILKLPAPPPANEAPVTSPRPNLWGVLQGLLGIRRQPAKSASSMSATSRITASQPVSPFPSEAIITGRGRVVMDASIQVVPPEMTTDTRPANDRTPDKTSQLAHVLGQSTVEPTLTIYLLGQFRVFVCDQAVESWPTGRGRAIFKYLIANCERPVPRDVLMDAFWPEAAPEAARNSLNVALHGLRQAFRNITDQPVLEHAEGVYRFSPGLNIWLDVDEFERHIKAGVQLEAAGKLSAATSEYEIAAGLYQGDFLLDEPYEEWAVLPRERLRSAHLDMLDRLSRIYFGQGHYASCVTLCQHILTQDNCREDIHCRLMRCYSRQGQHHLALRQYEACLSTLRTELDIKPTSATIQLCERVRRHERV